MSEEKEYKRPQERYDAKTYASIKLKAKKSDIAKIRKHCERREEKISPFLFRASMKQIEDDIKTEAIDRGLSVEEIIKEYDEKTPTGN